MNHSCSPNAGLVKFQNRLFIFSITEISPNDEITFDYSTCMNESEKWTMKCACESAECRGLIANFSLLPEALREKYIGMGIIPDFVVGVGS